ncbi:hypothetical protein AQ802_01575 [Burkholderia pseudomallei]|nr:hypothetical protein ACT79_08895 [Burkholderia pseudomallei]ARK43128.1 hypothetical protein BOC60_23095 [Burkholderia pseudomallei]OMR38370.1 hypothetical protein AQ725_23940 [Burkholderia pseudomallei]OMS76608.1 hypothetical protein AQ747_13380 [Burkholderia pseudomallei]OMT39834.1 hypothetical protein AQ758_17345 [Burkholderia pseudomallei]
MHAAEAHASRRGRAFAASPAGPLAHAAFIDRQTPPRETNRPREAGEWPFEWIRRCARAAANRAARDAPPSDTRHAPPAPVGRFVRTPE